MQSKGLSGYITLFIILGAVILTAGCAVDTNSGSDGGSQEDSGDLTDEKNGDAQINYSGVDYIMITSSAFEDGDKIPVKYTCDGQNINPPFEFENVPEGTQSLVLVVTDPDAPSGNFVHWVVWNIVPVSGIGENSVPGVVGKNSYGKTSYNGPCPASGTHGYLFRVFALDTKLELESGSRVDELEDAMQDHVLSEGQLTGRYGRA
ncbi:MAG: YbhB/YbcL family Raf kinase inhibitor-like protein [Methanolobus sp.]|nr:YbhB/YbcL family Raf kinase inhibitor-like protein [Methanolobus sp.]